MAQENGSLLTVLAQGLSEFVVQIRTGLCSSEELAEAGSPASEMPHS